MVSECPRWVSDRPLPARYALKLDIQPAGPGWPLGAPDRLEPRMGAAGRRLQAVKIGADVGAGRVQHPEPKPLGQLRPITRRVMIPHDRRISRPGNRAHLARSVQPHLAARYPVHRTAEAANAEQRQGAARSRRAAEQSVGGPESQPRGAAQHPHQPAMAHLLRLDNRRSRPC